MCYIPFMVAKIEKILRRKTASSINDVGKTGQLHVKLSN